MDLAVLSIFCQVVRRGGYAEVARLRKVTPSTVSRAVASLEHELGLRLFQRSTRKVIPTEAGIAYFERVERSVFALEEASQNARESNQLACGQVRVSAPTVFGEKVIVPALAAFLRKYPDLMVDMVLTDCGLDLLQERIDVAIRLGASPDSGLMARRLCLTSFVLCASPEYIARSPKILQPSDVAEHSCIRITCTGGADQRDQWIFRCDHEGSTCVEISGQVRLSSIAAAAYCAEQGLGVALLPAWAVRDQLPSKKLIPLLQNYEITPDADDSVAWITYPSREHIPRRVRLFIDHLARSVMDLNRLHQREHVQQLCTTSVAS